MFDLDDWLDALNLSVLLVLLALVFIVLAGCGREGESQLPIKAIAAPALMPAFETVSDEVNTAAGAVIVTKGYGLWIVEDSEPSRCGTFDAAHHEIKVRLNCGESVLILTHELGHALGLEHSADESSIMFPQVRYGWTAKQAAESLVRELGL